MSAVEKLSSYIPQWVYNVSDPFHPFGGAVDIIVVQQPDRSFKSSPWYVRFGKFQGVLKTREKVVTIAVNGIEAGFHMYLDHKGEAYFLKDADGEDGGTVMLSPPSSSGDETDEKNSGGPRIMKMQSYTMDGDGRRLKMPDVEIDTGDGTIVRRTSSRRSGLFGLMFGRRSMKESGGGEASVDRTSSIERAEIAADLLDTKWSTNLPASDSPPADSVIDASTKSSSHREGVDDRFATSASEEVDVHSSPSSSHQTTPGIDELNAINARESSNMNSVDDSLSPSLRSDATFEEPIDSHREQLGDDLRTKLISQVHFEERTTHTPGKRTHEEVIEITALEAGDLAERTGVIFESVMTEYEEFEVSPEGSNLKCASPNVQSDSFSLISHDSEQALDEIYDASEKQGKEVVSISYCETVESSNGRLSISNDNAQEALYLPSCPREQFGHSYKVICETAEAICEVKSEPSSSLCNEKEDVDRCQQLNLEISATEDSSHLEKARADWPGNEVFEDAITNGLYCDSSISGPGKTLTGSCSSYSADLIVSESEVIYHDKQTKNLAEEKDASSEPIVSPGHQPQTNGSVSAGPSTHILTPESVQQFHSDHKSECPESFDQVQGVAKLGKGFEGENSCLSNGVSIDDKVGTTSLRMETVKTRGPLSEISEDDQFLVSDIDGFGAKGTSPEEPSNGAAVKPDDYTLPNSEGDIDEHEMRSLHDGQSRESVGEASTTQTSPMTIPRSRAHLEEPELLIRSLPIIRSQIHDLEPSHLLYPRSCSLNVNSEKNDQALLEKEMPNSSDQEAVSKSNTSQDDHMVAAAVDAEKWDDQKGAPTNPAVELSLCRHLLFEGMGADAASEAFNVEKVNLETFSALGPSVVRNERLVVRIGHHYFPWDAAAPIILGMVSFGQGEIYEPQGMIYVDRSTNNLKGDATMREMIPSGGSWRLWPFTFRKSKTITTVRSTTEGTIVADVDTASESPKKSRGSIDAQKAKTTKLKEKSLIPTSEELASLNLKEGPNVITFTFSTTMLGRQQVDARIYLWKWNTHIVVSDVDGTITKSDVLGQFMPLVGIDWSQTGVAHLFSAIKENGYQLLFLSARAISQAYITRQFLFNLKQDGKALPDGPVVISPDGLFPSLYREVIRRAPHEFKISCLEDIKALFPPDCNPFYAGFGNRNTDEVSYLKVGIPKGKIFIINTKGEVAVNRRVDTKSYTSLHALVNGMFPPMSSAEQEDFNSWNYWKLPLLDIDL